MKPLELLTDEYVVALLERIAFQTQGQGRAGFEDYLRMVTANATAKRDEIQSKDDLQRDEPSSGSEDPFKWRNPFTS